jgi:tetratricopeptide (TPR) repeat protein
MDTRESAGMRKRIDDYFEGKLSVTERHQFENDLKSDSLLAAAMSEQLDRQGAVKSVPASGKGHPFTSLMTWYGVAAVVALVTFGLCWLWMMPAKDRQQLSSGYAMENFTTLSTSGAVPDDSIQLAVTHYNRGQYGTAMKICTEILERDPQHAAANRIAGIVSMKRLDYKNAIHYFNKLSQLKGISDNPGKFYEAVALLQSGLAEDEQRAKKLLREVIDEDLYGKEEAGKWM